MNCIKRLFMTFVAATLLFIFVGCEEKVLLTPIQELDTAFAKTHTLECISSEVSAKGEMNGVTIVMSGVCNYTKKLQEGVRWSLNLSFLGQSLEVVCADETLYTKSGDKLIKKPLLQSETNKLFSGLTENKESYKLDEYLRDITRSVDDDGNTVISGSIDINACLKAIGLDSSLENALNDFSFDDPKVSYHLNKDGYISEIFIDIILSGGESIQLFENGVNVNLNIVVKYIDPGQTFTIEPPANADDYKTIVDYELDNKEPEIFAA